MLERQGMHRLPASESLRTAFLAASSDARDRLDEQTLPHELLGKATTILGEYRAAHPTR
jgi:hypothetical protein